MTIRQVAALCSFALPLLVLISIAPRSIAQDRLNERELRFFEAKIRPVLIEQCYDCHSSDNDEPGGGLVLDNRESLRKGGNSGTAVIEGRPNSSLILLAMKHTEPDLVMPPEDYGEKLSDEVIADFERWIRAGAADPREPISQRSDGTEKTRSPSPWDQESASKHWAWKPPQQPSLPASRAPDWATTDIDRFVYDRLLQSELTPSPPADRAALVRRLAIDLTGLPPAPEDLQQFALGSRLSSIEIYVDKLLESERYGERFGRHWLDAARYAESSGKDVNVSYPQAWRYRDYVIDAFNADLPYNQFIAEQLAGDLLPSATDEQRRTLMIATGFLALGPKSVNEMNPRQFAADQVDEQIDAVSQAFLGVTISCARCHDHKFDPISQRDYTALAGIFLSTDTHFGTSGGVGGRNRSELLTLPPSATETPAGRKLSKSELENLKERIRDLEEERRELIAARRSGQQDSNQALSALRTSQQLVRLNLQLDSYDEDGRPNSQAMGVSDKPVAPRFARFQSRFTRNLTQGPQLALVARELNFIQDSPQLVRGEIDKPGDAVPRGLPTFLAANYLSPTEQTPSNESGRLQLAMWIASEQNPLTSRVIVNRVWAWLMGEGLVATEDNFGTSGELPSNPELLDYLATNFVEHGWSMKTLVRSIVLSRSYQQASSFRPDAFDIDPDNRLLWRANKRALDAESLRDGMLAISGKLTLTRPKGTLISEAGDGLIGGPRGRGGLSEAAIMDVESSARSIYLPTPRNVLPDALQLFDFADNSRVAGDRDLTIVPSQALYWMNSPVVEDLCEEIAAATLGDRAREEGRLENSTQAETTSGQQRRREAIERNLSRLPPRLRNRLMNRAGSNEQVYRQPEQSRPMKYTLDKSSIKALFHDLTIQVLARPPLQAESRAVINYVTELQKDGESQLSIWTGVTRSLFSSADYRFLL